MLSRKLLNLTLLEAIVQVPLSEESNQFLVVKFLSSQLRNKRL